MIVRWALPLVLLFCAGIAGAQSGRPPLRDEALPYIAAEAEDGRVSRGSGVVIDARGRLLTALHVVQGAVSITAQWHGKPAVPLTVAGIVPEADLAVLRLPARDTPYVFYPPVSPLWQGHVREQVEVAGHPLAFERQLLGGSLPQDGFVHSNTIMTADGHAMLHVDKVDLLLVVVTAPNGLSGGPVLTQNGEVAAILSGSYTQSAGYAFAAPTKYLVGPTYVSYERAPQQIRPWPPYVFADLGTLRALTRSLVPQDTCAAAIENFKSVARSSQAAALVVSRYLSFAQPTIDRVRHGKIGDDAARWAQLELVWNSIAAPAQQAVDKLQARDQAWAAIMVECSPVPKLLASRDALNTVPVNGRNIVAGQIQAARLEELSRKLQQLWQQFHNISAGINEMLARGANLTDQSPISLRIKVMLDAFDQARNLMSYVGSGQGDAESQAGIDAIRYARDLSDSMADYPWDRRPADPPFTELGVSVKPLPGWVHITDELVRVAMPLQQVANWREVLPRFVILRYARDLMHGEFQVSAVISRMTAPGYAPTELGMRREAEAAIQAEAAGQRRTLGRIQSSAKQIGSDWMSEALETPATSDAPRKQWLIRYASPDFIFMNCTLLSETAPFDLCRMQFDQITANR